MKKFFLGLVLGLMVLPVAQEISSITRYYDIAPEISDKVWSFSIITPRLGFADVITKSCTKDVSENGHGWVFVRRKYYRCNKLEIYLSDLFFGEYTKPRNPELEKKACKDCRL